MYRGILSASTAGRYLSKGCEGLVPTYNLGLRRVVRCTPRRCRSPSACIRVAAIWAMPRSPSTWASPFYAPGHGLPTGLDRPHARKARLALAVNLALPKLPRVGSGLPVPGSLTRRCRLCCLRAASIMKVSLENGPTMIETENLKQTVDALCARIHAIRDSL